MVDDIDKYIDVLCELEITEHQFLILWLISNKDEANIAKYRLKFKNFKTNEILDLIDRGFIEDFGVVRDGIQTFNIYDFLITDSFKKRMIVDTDDAFEELVSAYPSFFNIKGQKVPAKAYDERLAEEYRKYHKNSKSKHDKVIEITKNYHEKFTKGFAQKKIEDYIRGKIWIIYEEALKENNADIGFKMY